MTDDIEDARDRVLGVVEQFAGNEDEAFMDIAAELDCRFSPTAWARSRTGLNDDVRTCVLMWKAGGAALGMHDDLLGEALDVQLHDVNVERAMSQMAELKLFQDHCLALIRAMLPQLMYYGVFTPLEPSTGSWPVG